MKKPNIVVRLLLCALMMAGAIWGQGLTGSISGIVKDPNGASVPNAKVTARNVGTNAEVDTRTDENGYYRITNLVPGNYTIAVEATGFRRSETAPQQLNIAAALRQDVTLEIGTVTETIQVSGEALQINTEDAQLGISITQLSNLPNISGAAGRNPLNLVGLEAGREHGARLAE